MRPKITVVIPVSQVEEEPNSFRVVRSDTGAVMHLTKKPYVEFYPGRVVIPQWYANLIKADAPKG